MDAHKNKTHNAVSKFTSKKNLSNAASRISYPQYFYVPPTDTRETIIGRQGDSLLLGIDLLGGLVVAALILAGALLGALHHGDTTVIS